MRPLSTSHPGVGAVQCKSRATERLTFSHLAEDLVCRAQHQTDIRPLVHSQSMQHVHARFELQSGKRLAAVSSHLDVRLSPSS